MLDAWATPMVMKKSRPAVMVQVLVEEADAERLSRDLLMLTGSFGVRSRMWDRIVLDRYFESVSTSAGMVRVKVGRLDGRVLSVKAEFDDAAIAARQHDVPVRQVLDEAVQAWHLAQSDPAAFDLRRRDIETLDPPGDPDE